MARNPGPIPWNTLCLAVNSPSSCATAHTPAKASAHSAAMNLVVKYLFSSMSFQSVPDPVQVALPGVF
jgi:hypothetical protein